MIGEIVDAGQDTQWELETYRQWYLDERERRLKLEEEKHAAEAELLDVRSQLAFIEGRLDALEIITVDRDAHLRTSGRVALALADLANCRKILYLIAHGVYTREYSASSNHKSELARKAIAELRSFAAFHKYPSNPDYGNVCRACGYDEDVAHDEDCPFAAGRTA